MTHRITVREIAARADVNPATVSRALNPETASMISREMREKITGICNELGYRPSLSARSMSTGRTYRIGMILGDIESDLTAHDWVRLIKGLSGCLQKHDYTLSILWADRTAKALDHQVATFLMSGAADGYVTGPGMLRGEAREILNKRKAPVVTVCESGDSTDIGAYVQRDDTEAFQTVWQALPKKDIPHCAYFAPDFPKISLRCKEIIRAGTELGLDVSGLERITFDGITKMEYRSAYRAAVRLFDRLKEKRLIWCASDLGALGLCDALEDRGIRVGKDLFVVGYGNLETFPGVCGTPRLSTINANADGIGNRLGKLLLDRIGGKNVKTVVMKTEYIGRETFPCA